MTNEHFKHALEQGFTGGSVGFCVGTGVGFAVGSWVAFSSCFSVGAAVGSVVAGSQMDAP